jgi:uncharacterized membrane protein
MAKDLEDILRDSLSQVVRDAAQSLGDAGTRKSNGALSGMRGVAVGAGLAVLAPLATKTAGKALKRRFGGGAAKQVVKKPAEAVSGAASKVIKKPAEAASSAASKVVKKPAEAVSGATSKVGDSVGEKVKETVGEKVEEAGGVGGVAKEAGKTALPGVGGDGGGPRLEGVGKGRRMPVQQSVDVAVPIETAYNQWTQFEDWPNFMHRVNRVTQEDDCTVSFATKIWGITKEFVADIETQRPDERIKWRVSDGVTHTGVVTFHELAPRLTRIELNVDVDPGSLIEKAARSMRHVKRAVRADLHRFKAYIEMQEEETGAWRGVIEDGELVEPHPEEYDDELEYRERDREPATEPEGRGKERHAREEPEEAEKGKATREAGSRGVERQPRAAAAPRRPPSSNEQKSPSRQRKQAARRQPRSTKSEPTRRSSRSVRA